MNSIHTWIMDFSAGVIIVSLWFISGYLLDIKYLLKDIKEKLP